MGNSSTPTSRAKSRDPVFSFFERISQSLNLGRLLSAPELCSFCKLQQVWKIQTVKGTFAMKCLDPLRFGESSEVFRSRVYATETIAHAFKASGVPAIVALNHAENVLIFKWVEGNSITPDRLSRHEAEHIAGLLSQLHTRHAINEMDTSILNSSLYERVPPLEKWGKINKLHGIHRLLKLVIPSINRAVSHLKKKRVLSHRDVTPRNVIWTDSLTPNLIDWELAGCIHPTVEVIGAAFDWSIVTPDVINESNFHALCQAYTGEQGALISLEEGFLGVMGIWLNWLYSNLEHLPTSVSEHRPIYVAEIEHTVVTFEKVYARRKHWLDLMRSCR